MRRIGLTGGIASGKSTVTRRLRSHGAVVLDGDDLYHALLESSTALNRAIRETFGQRWFDPSGRLNRQAFGRWIFARPEELKRLSDLTAPFILDAFLHASREAERAGESIVFWSHPLLYEGRVEEELDGVIVVWARDEIILRRLRERNGFDEAEARRRMASQLPLAEKRKRADWLIDNSGSLAETEGQVDALWTELSGRACG